MATPSHNDDLGLVRWRTGVCFSPERMVALGEQIAGGGGPPTDEQGAQMGRIQKNLEIAGKVDLVLLLLAVAAMSTARYW